MPKDYKTGKKKAYKKLAKGKDAGSGTGGLETNRNDNHSQKFG